MIGFTFHSDDTQSSKPRKAHDNPVYHSRSLTRGDPKEITDAIKLCEVGDVYQVGISGLPTLPDWQLHDRNSDSWGFSVWIGQ
jgi:hypothetical protein